VRCSGLVVAALLSVLVVVVLVVVLGRGVVVCIVCQVDGLNLSKGIDVSVSGHCLPDLTSPTSAVSGG
jgi:hypothetical protein